MGAFNFESEVFMARNGYSDDTCIICGKQLTRGHKTPYCQQHLIENRQKEKIDH